VIPGSSIKSDEDVMLDGMTLENLRRELGAPVLPMDFNAFARMMESADAGC
jgi:NifB/MoaA-like Fe-S oxidoreductase